MANETANAASVVRTTESDRSAEAADDVRGSGAPKAEAARTHASETEAARARAMDEVLGYLTHIPAWYLATIDENDPAQPRVRPFSFAAVDGGKLWFSTSRDKDVWRELSANPKFEASGWHPGEGWIVLSGEAVLDDDAVVSDKVRQDGFDHMMGLGEHHDSPDDGRLAYFSVRDARARFCDIDGNERVVEF